MDLTDNEIISIIKKSIKSEGLDLEHNVHDVINLSNICNVYLKHVKHAFSNYLNNPNADDVDEQGFDHYFDQNSYTCLRTMYLVLFDVSSNNHLEPEQFGDTVLNEKIMDRMIKKRNRNIKNGLKQTLLMHTCEDISNIIIEYALI